MSTSRDELMAYVISQIKMSASRLTEFAVALQKNPTAALEVSESAFDAAANLRVLEIVKSNLDRDQPVETIIATAVRESIRGARFPKRSTSPTSNLMAQCLAAAWGEIAAWAAGSL